MRRPASLPRGFTIQEDGTSLRLFDSHGTLLLTRANTTRGLMRIHEYAWRVAWHEVERQMKERLRKRRLGKAPDFDDPDRLAQYRRFLSHEAMMMPVRALPRWLAPVLVAALVTVAILTLTRVLSPAPLPLGWEASNSALLAARSAIVIRDVPASVARSTRRLAMIPFAAAPAPRDPAATSRRRALSPYTIALGRFQDRLAAEEYAHHVARKGYAATVVIRREGFVVRGSLYRKPSSAFRVAGALRLLGISARVVRLAAL